MDHIWNIELRLSDLALKTVILQRLKKGRSIKKQTSNSPMSCKVLFPPNLAISTSDRTEDRGRFLEVSPVMSTFTASAVSPCTMGWDMSTL